MSEEGDEEENLGSDLDAAFQFGNTPLWDDSDESAEDEQTDAGKF